MELDDLISPEVLKKVKDGLANFEHWIAYNNTLLFVHESDIQLFTNQEDAANFADNNEGEYDRWDIVRIENLADFIGKVEACMPGVTYKPAQAAAEVNESPASYFPKEQLLQNRKIMMNEQNLKYLKNQLDFLGFDESLHGLLEQKMKEGKPEFSLEANAEYGQDKMQAVIHFRFSEKDGKEAYFCNHYIATLLREDQNRSQFIYVNNKGQSVTFKESCNLLNSRSVYKEITPKEGSVYKAWLKIDHENIDQKTGYPKLRQFTGNYGFDLMEAVSRMPFKVLKYDDQLKGLVKSLRKGNLTNAMLMKDGKEVQVNIEANPQMHTLNMYDKNGEPLYYPSKKTEQKYGQAPVDAKRQEQSAVLNEPGMKYERKDLLAKKGQDNGLLEKKKTRAKSKSPKIS